MQSYTPPKLALGSASGLVLVKYNVQGLLAMKTFKSSVCYLLQVSYGGLLLFMSVILLLPANAFTSLWHVASEQFNRPNPSSPVWIEYQEHGGKPSPAMSLSFRLSMWWLILGNLAVIIFWQKVVAEGPVAKAFALRFPSSRPKFRL
jgi:hypothetical protein